MNRAMTIIRPQARLSPVGKILLTKTGMARVCRYGSARYM
jgi:hypothetical protein